MKSRVRLVRHPDAFASCQDDWLTNRAECCLRNTWRMDLQLPNPHRRSPASKTASRFRGAEPLQQSKN